MNQQETIKWIKDMYKETRGYWDDLDVPNDMDFEVISEGGYEGDDKYQYAEDVLKINNKYYCAIESRCGSYFSDYDYNLQDVYEAVRTEKTVVQVVWEKV